MENKKNENKNTFMWIMFAVVLIFVLLFPVIQGFIDKLSLPKVEGEVEKPKEEEKVINEDVLETIHFPLMRSSVYSPNTYYSLNEFTISNLSNSDILLNAYLDIYEGNITPYSGGASCTNEPKQFNQDYLELRIKNILGKSVNYSLEDFYVSEDSGNKYVGNWRYDSGSSSFIYEGLCQSSATNIKYYDLKQLIKMDYNDNDIIATYYVGFAKVEGNNYIIYSDAAMQNQIGNGSINDAKELDEIFKKIDNKNKKTYKYTFKDSLCKYNEYCLYKGEWINE